MLYWTKQFLKKLPTILKYFLQSILQQALACKTHLMDAQLIWKMCILGAG